VVKFGYEKALFDWALDKHKVVPGKIDEEIDL